MTTTTAPERLLPIDPEAAAHLGALARAESIRFARHPLFLLGTTATIAVTVLATVSVGRLDPDPLAMPILPAFCLGVFGFVVAHRLTTSLRRTGELVGTAPIEQRRRTAALCLACLVPAAVGLLWVVGMVVLGSLWPPLGDPASAPVAWFGDESAADVLSVLLASAPVAALGGSLVGVAVARWAPFRGSALLGVVALIALVSVANVAKPWAALSPYVVFPDEAVKHGKIVSSWLSDEIAPPWYLLYTLCLCGLAVVAALLRDEGERRRLLGIGATLGLAALGCFALAVS